MVCSDEPPLRSPALGAPAPVVTVCMSVTGLWIGIILNPEMEILCGSSPPPPPLPLPLSPVVEGLLFLLLKLPRRLPLTLPPWCRFPERELLVVRNGDSSSPRPPLRSPDCEVCRGNDR